MIRRPTYPVPYYKRPPSTAVSKIQTVPSSVSGILARRFDGTDDELRTSTGSVDPTGAVTMAAVVRKRADGVLADAIALHNSGGGVIAGLGFSGGNKVQMLGSNRVGTTDVLVSDGWVIIAVTKASGTNTPRAHIYKGGSWTHENMSGTQANYTSIAGGHIGFGSRNSIIFTAMDIAVVAVWHSELSDANVATLEDAWATQDWADLSPAGGWEYNQTDVATDVTDWTGNGANQSSITGTTVINDGPAAWTYGAVEPGQTIAVDQASETDTAQAHTSHKTKAISQSSETDTAQAITAHKTQAVSQSSETDTAQTHTSLKTKALTQTLETDTAQAITRNPQAQLINQSSETDTAQAITARKTVTVNQVLETDEAQAIDYNPIARLIESSSESDTAQEITERKTKAIGLTTETDTALRLQTGIYARQFDGNNDEITVSVGNSNLTGAFTIATLIRKTVDDSPSLLVINSTSAPFRAVSLGINASNLLQVGIGPTTRQSTSTITVEDDWVIVVVTKTSGTTTPRFHIYKAGSWTHENADGTVGDPTSADTIHFLSWDIAGGYYPGEMAVAGEWDSALSDGNIETLDDNWATQDWYDLSPVGLWDFDQTSIATPVEDITGGGADEISSNETTVITDGPADWQYFEVAEQIIPVDQSSETDTAQGITARKTVTLGQASETDTAQALTRNPQARLINQSIESDTAQEITERKTQAITQALETDTAQEIDYDPITRLIGIASESDTAQAITVVVTKAINQVEEIDVAQAIDHDKNKAIGQSQETDTAQNVTAVRTQTITVGQVTETDTAQTVTALKTETVEQALETDEAGSVQRPGQVAQAFESDIAQAITARKTRSIGQVSESDTSQSITSHKTKTTGLTLETDLAQNVYTYTRVTQVSETDTAQPITARKYKVLGQTSESDTAQEITSGAKVISVTQVIEVDYAFEIGGIAALGVRNPGLVNLNENQFTDIFTLSPNNIHEISAPNNQAINPEIVLKEIVSVTNIVGIEFVPSSLDIIQPSNFKSISAQEIINQIIETQGIHIDNPGFIVLNENEYTNLIATENSLGITPETPLISIDALDSGINSIVSQQVVLAIDEEPSIIVIIEPENSKQVLQQENTRDLVETP